MTLVRADALRDVGGWAEWTVTEDAELGLRLLAAGYEAVYTPDSYGRGLTPDRFADYRAQRHRWALGAVQILKHHSRKLLGLAPSRLSLGQRLHFLTGWLPWLGDGLNLVFNVLAVGWSTLMIADPARFNPPLAVLSSFVLAAFGFKLIKTVALYRAHIGTSWTETAFACCAGLALIHVVGRAVIAGIFAGVTPFFRTPKFTHRDSRVGALIGVGSEAMLAVALLACAVGVVVTAPFASMDRSLWTALLLVSALPHCTAVVLALIASTRVRSSRNVRLLAGPSRAERV